MKLLPLDDLSCDVLILGAGGAGMLAALHVTTANPTARIVIAVKGLIGQSGCTRMVQGGYNCVLNSADSFDKHFDDTITRRPIPQRPGARLGTRQRFERKRCQEPILGQSYNGRCSTMPSHSSRSVALAISSKS